MAATLGPAAARMASAQVVRASRDWSGWCLMFTRKMLGLPWVAPSAIKAWADVDRADRHTSIDPPIGVPVFWEIGRHGHVAVSAGGGKVYSTDIRRTGKVDLVPIGEIARRWGARYLGWSETLGPFRVYTPPKKTPPKKTPAPKPSPGDLITIRRGDTVSELVARHAPGTSWRAVWRHDRNDALRARRGRPEYIRPGDKLWVP